MAKDRQELKRKFSSSYLFVTGSASAGGTVASVLAVAGPAWLAIAAGVAAGAAAVVLTNEIPEK